MERPRFVTTFKGMPEGLVVPPGCPIEHIKPHGTSLTEDQIRARDLIANSPARHICLVGGARSGKTSLVVRTIVLRAMRSKMSRHLIARHRHNAIRSSIVLDTFPKVMRMWFPYVSYFYSSRDGYFELEDTGSQIWCGGLDENDRVEKILGQEYATIFANEVSQINYSTILVMRTRLAQPGTKLKLKGFYDLNPTSTQHWSNVEFGEKRNPLDGTSLKDPENYERVFMNPEGNKENLDPEFIQSLRNMPTMFRERFYEGKYTVEVEGALWTPDLIEMRRENEIFPDGKRMPEFQRISIGVDPSGAQSKNDIKSDDIGIVVAGKRHTNHAVILKDATMKGSPKDWGRAVVAEYKRWRADVVVAEANYGGAMVQATIQAVDPNVNVQLVTASRGKVIRAEPISALYEEDKVRHAGRFNQLEAQMCLFSHAGYKGDRSPDRADAMIWAVTSLMLGEISTYTLANI